MKKIYLFKTLLLLCALMAGSGSAWAEDSETLTMNNKTSVSGDNVILEFGQGSNTSNGPALNNNKTRLYPGNTITITSNGGKYLSQVDFSFVTNNGGSGSNKACPTGVTVSTGTETFGTTTTSTTSGSWIAEGETTTTVTITIQGAKGNYTFDTAKVYYVKSTNPSATLSSSSLDFGEVEVGQTKQLTFTITPANLTGDLTIASNNGKYTVSPASIDQATKTATTITVTAAPTTLNDDMDGTITISGGGLASNKTVTLTATPYQVANVTLAGDNGTFEVNDETVTSITSRVGSKANVKAVPARGYLFTSWAAEGATPASSTDAETEFTFTAASVTLTATFTEIPKYTVTFADNSATITEEYGSEGITLPSRDAIADYTFEGWATENLATETTTAPASIMLAGSNYKPTANITLYPVYTREEGNYVEKTSSVTISKYAEDNSWVGSSKYYTVTVAEGITVNTNDKGTTGQYNSSDNTWRMYQTNQNASVITVNAATGKQLKSVTFTYSVNNDGVLVYNSNNVSSGTSVDLSGSASDKFTVGNTGSATNGQVRITAISVSYTSGSSTFYYTSSPVTTVPVTITAAKYATYCGTRNLNFSTTGIKAYTAEDGETSVTLNEISSGQVPAKTPVVLYNANADGTAIDVPVIASAEAITGDNDLDVVGAGGLTGVDYIYVLAMNPTIGFYLWDKNETLNEGKVYLQSTESGGGGARQFLPFSSETQGISATLNNNETINNVVFDLQGRRVAKPAKGLYIMDGRKVMVK